jgi:hypothetical protein
MLSWCQFDELREGTLCAGPWGSACVHTAFVLCLLGACASFQITCATLLFETPFSFSSPSLNVLGIAVLLTPAAFVKVVGLL